MKVLVVGGTGLTGAHASLLLRDEGHSVTIMSRSRPVSKTLSDFEFLPGNYVENDIPLQSLTGFDWLVFAAGADVRQLPPGETVESFFTRVNTVAIPRFFEKALNAGISRAVYIGSYYPQIVPQKIRSCPYVRSRHLADEAVRSLSRNSFSVCSLNAPFILGHVPGVDVQHLKSLVQYAAGRLEGIPVAAPAGGVNHITSKSMAEAIRGALRNGKSGKAYLVGDENLSWKEYLETFFKYAGNPQDLVITKDEHPMLPDTILYAGRNASISYEPENGELDYSRNNVKNSIRQIVEAYL